MRAQPPPDRARARPRTSGPCADAERVERHARRVQQPRHVVVGRHEQRRRVRERLVVEQQARVDVTVRRDHRQLAHGVVELARDRADSGSAGSSRSGCSASAGAVPYRAITRGRCEPRGAHEHTTAPDPLAAARIGGPGGVLDDEQIRAFVRDQLAAVPLDGRSVCVIVPDGTRSCPLPLLLSAVHGALHGRVTRLTVLVALGTHAAMERAGAGRAPRLPGGGSPSAIPARPCSTTRGGTRRRS